MLKSGPLQPSPPPHNPIREEPSVTRAYKSTSITRVVKPDGVRCGYFDLHFKLSDALSKRFEYNALSGLVIRRKNIHEVFK